MTDARTTHRAMSRPTGLTLGRLVPPPRRGGFVWDVAGPDAHLAVAYTDVRAGRIGSTSELLRTTREERDFARRAYVSAVLGSAASSSNLAEMWAKDEPGSPDATLLWARVAAIRVLREQNPSSGYVRELLAMAVRAIERAADTWDPDPTPHVIGLSVDRLRFRHPWEPPAGLTSDVVGPWDRFEQVVLRDKDNREAGHHLMAFFLPRHGGRDQQARAVAHWLTGFSPTDSPLHLLPLYAEVECARDGQAAVLGEDDWDRMAEIRNMIDRIDNKEIPGDPSDLARRRQTLARRLAQDQDPVGYRREALHRWAATVFDRWFLRRTPTYLVMRDLSVLAHALHAGGHRYEAGAVLRAMSPYATTYPWSPDGDPHAALVALADAFRDCGIRLPRPG
jgi:hypothetical protein